MTAYFWPLDIKPAAQRWRLNSRSAISLSPLNGYSQTVSRPGQFWSSELDFPPLCDDDLERLSSFLHMLSDQADTFYLPDFRGGLASAVDLNNVIDNGTFRDVTADIPDNWSTDNAQAHYIGAGWMQCVNSTGASECRVYQAITSYTASGFYCLSFNVRLLGSATIKAELGTTIGGNELASITTLGNGGAFKVFTAPSSGTFYVSFSTDSLGAGVGWLLSNIAIVPMLEVASSATQGARLARARGFLEHSPTVSRSALRAGQLVSIRTVAEYTKQDTHRLLTNAHNRYSSNDEAYLLIEPPLRRDLAVGDDILLGVQGGPEMRLADPVVTLADLPGHSGVTIGAVERLQ